MLVNDFLEKSAKIFPNKIALICQSGRYTYSEIDDLSNKLAKVLILEGLQKGDRVAIYLENSFEAVIAIFAILKAGGVFVIVNPTMKLHKLLYILNNCRTRAIFVFGRTYNEFKKICQEVPSLGFSIFCGKKNTINKSNLTKKLLFFQDTYRSLTTNLLIPQNIDIDLAAIIYTSGSTGDPKGVMMTHLNIVSAATSITQYLDNTDKDIIINVFPLSFDYGLYQVFMAFKMGATLILEKSFPYPYALVNTILKEKVTGLPIVPTLAAILLKLETLKKHNFDHLRYISNTAAHLPLSYVKQMRRVFPKTKIYLMYGLTECKRVSYLPPDQIDIRPNSVGKSMPNVETYIIKEDGERAAPGEVGELVVRGSNVMKGYWEMPEETDRMLRPGLNLWGKILYTGDLFKMDEENYLYFVGRKDDIIKSRGEKVSPKEIENVLCSMNGVVEAAVIGVPDEILGQAVKAIIVPSDDITLTKKDVLSYCSRHLENFMMPKFVEFHSSLPKISSGKIDKKALINNAKHKNNLKQI